MSTASSTGSGTGSGTASWLPGDPSWARVREELLDVDGRAVRVLRADAEGTGAEPQLLVHGLGGSAANWIDVVAPLAEHGPVVAVDLPGFGHTRATEDDPLTLRGYADFVPAVLRALGWERATLHGNSMGGLVSTLVAARHPELVERLVLVSPAFAPSFPLRLLPPSLPTVQGMVTMGVPSISGALLAAATRRGENPGARALLGLIFTDPDAVRPALLAAMAADTLSADAAQQADRRRALRSATASIARTWVDPRGTWRAIRRVEAPTLLLGGTADALVPARVLREVLAARPDWTGEVITDRRHALMLSEPEEYLDHVTWWRAETPAAA